MVRTSWPKWFQAEVPPLDLANEPATDVLTVRLLFDGRRDTANGRGVIPGHCARARPATRAERSPSVSKCRRAARTPEYGSIGRSPPTRGPCGCCPSNRQCQVCRSINPCKFLRTVWGVASHRSRRRRPAQPHERTYPDSAARMGNQRLTGGRIHAPLDGLARGRHRPGARPVGPARLGNSAVGGRLRALPDRPKHCLRRRRGVHPARRGAAGRPEIGGRPHPTAGPVSDPLVYTGVCVSHPRRFKRTSRFLELAGHAR